MGNVFTTLDLLIFFGSLVLVMAVGLWAGRREDTAADYFLAGRKTRWWGIAGSIFGSNVSASHMVGMMGIGFTVGFAQSHFEFTAIAGLLILCYGFLPVYRRLRLYTLSEYLSHRYGESSRILYAVIILILIVIVEMVPSFYIGSRSLNILLQSDAGTTQMLNPLEQSANLTTPDAATPTKIQINRQFYIYGILLMALVTGTYTFFGGLKAVIVTDVIQSVLMIAAGIVVAILTFSQPEIGGWAGMRQLDAAGRDMMHLYLPTDHPDLPWSGVLTGLMILHFYYWGTNQFIVQRALSARSDREGRIGIITAGFFKLLIPFFSIGTGVAAFYLFQSKGIAADGDVAFPMLMRNVVAPVGYGVVGLVAAGLIGAILSSLDSMMNSAATVVTMDFYKRYINPNASERALIWMGRAWIAIFVTAAAVLCIFTMDPNSDKSFFLQIAAHQGNLVAGIVVAFGLGMVWRRATAMGATAAILTGITVSYGLPAAWTMLPAGSWPIETFGERLNFMHTAISSAACAAFVHVLVSLATTPDAEKAKYTWTELGGHDPRVLKRTGAVVVLSLAIFAFLGYLVYRDRTAPPVAGAIAAVWTWAMFLSAAINAIKRAKMNEPEHEAGATTLLKEDRFWAGLLAGAAVFMLYYFY